VISFTRHARNRMGLYRIAVEEVRQCVEQPEETASTGAGKTNYFRSRSGGWLRVTVAAEGGDMVIISVTPRRSR
jgi:Domain of unknown function (DUF4258)